MRCERRGALKLRFGHPRFFNLPKPIAEFVVKSCRVGSIAKPCLQDSKALTIILFFHEGSFDKKIELFVFWRERRRLLKRLEGFFGLIIAFVSLRKQILDACAFMVSFTQCLEDGNRLWKFAYAHVAERQIEFGGVIIGNMAARREKMRDRF